MTDKPKTVKDRDTDKPIRVLEPYTPYWHKLAYQVMQSYIQIKACRDCGGPVHHMYCCGRCGSTNP